MARAVTIPWLALAHSTARAVGTSIPLAMAAPWPMAAGGVNTCWPSKYWPATTAAALPVRGLLVCQHRPVLSTWYNFLVI